LIGWCGSYILIDSKAILIPMVNIRKFDELFLKRFVDCFRIKQT